MVTTVLVFVLIHWFVLVLCGIEFVCGEYKVISFYFWQVHSEQAEEGESKNIGEFILLPWVGSCRETYLHLPTWISLCFTVWLTVKSSVLRFMNQLIKLPGGFGLCFSWTDQLLWRYFSTIILYLNYRFWIALWWLIYDFLPLQMHGKGDSGFFFFNFFFFCLFSTQSR